MGTSTTIESAPAAVPRVLPLRTGDRLTREEFERRFDAMPHLKKAELIEGVVYVASPVSNEEHGKPHFDIITWLGVYRSLTPGVEGGDNSSLRLDLDNEPQPDVFLRLLAAFGGQSRIDERGYVVGAPELVTEVSASSASYDLHVKLHVYRRSGVREYVVWRVLESEVDWFVLRGSRFERLLPGADGIFRSEAFPGLWLDSAALLRGDMARVLQVAQQGVASPEHAQYVASLQEKAPR